MSGLQGSRRASKGKAPAEDSKDNTEKKHSSVPSFGFNLPAFERTTTLTPSPTPTPQKLAASTQPSTQPTPPAAVASKSPSSALSPRPTATPTTTPAASKSSEATENPNVQAPAKPLSQAEVAAAATRARMAEIMGPPRRQGQSSGFKKRELSSLSTYSNSYEK